MKNAATARKPPFLKALEAYTYNAVASKKPIIVYSKNSKFANSNPLTEVAMSANKKKEGHWK